MKLKHFSLGPSLGPHANRNPKFWREQAAQFWALHAEQEAAIRAHGGQPLAFTRVRDGAHVADAIRASAELCERFAAECERDN